MKRWIVPTVMLLMVAYYVYIPLPTNAREPRKQRILALILRIVDDVTTITSVFGIDWVTTVRAFSDTTVKDGKYIERQENGVKITENSFDGIRVRIYRPITQSKDLLPGIIYIHGGGWILLSIDDYDSFTKSLANITQSVVVSVNYRRAPEHIFPAAFDDCVKAAKYFLRNAESLGVNSAKIGIAGDSAGGNLAMAVSLYLGKENIVPKLNFQGLIYPALQAMDYNLTSYREFDIPLRSSYTPITKSAMIFYYNMYGFGSDKYIKYFHENTHTTRETKMKYRKYVDPSNLPSKYKMQPDDAASKENKEIADQLSEVILNPYFAPLMASDDELKLLPRTYLMTAEYDGLRDEGMILGNRLRRVNHPLLYKHWEGIEHGFMVNALYETYWECLKHFSSYIKNVNES